MPSDTAMPDGRGREFPPHSAADIDAYPIEEVVEGYSEFLPDDPEPGPNRSPGYRWGWVNRKRDSQPKDDGFDGVRQAYFREFRSPPPLLRKEGEDETASDR